MCVLTEKGGAKGGASGDTADAMVPSRLDLRVGKITKVEKVGEKVNCNS